MTQYVSYLRVSTQRQGISGLGIEAQRRAVQQYVAQPSTRNLAHVEKCEDRTIVLKSAPMLNFPNCDQVLGGLESDSPLAPRDLEISHPGLA